MSVSDGFGKRGPAEIRGKLPGKAVRRAFLPIIHALSGSIVSKPRFDEYAMFRNGANHNGDAAEVARYELNIHVSRLRERLDAAIPEGFRGVAARGGDWISDRSDKLEWMK